MSSVKELESKLVAADSRITENAGMLQIHRYEFNNLKDVNTKILSALEKLEQAITVLNSKVDIIPLSYISSVQFEKFKEYNLDYFKKHEEILDEHEDRLNKYENNWKWITTIVVFAIGLLQFLFQFGLEKFFR